MNFIQQNILTLTIIVSCAVSYNSATNNDTEIVVEKTGFYGIYVKSMPFWTFWNYNKALNAMAEAINKTPESVSTTIELEKKYDIKLPILITPEYQKAEALQKDLQKFNCDLEIREIKFTCKNEQKTIESQITQVASLVNNAISSCDSTDLSAQREAVIRALEEQSR